MKLRITHIPPVRASLTVVGVYIVLALISTVIFTTFALLSGNSVHGFYPPFTGMLLTIGAYLIAVYIIVILFCLAYNIIAKRTGGIEVIVEEK